jgi:biopolymer transport protein ExbD
MAEKRRFLDVWLVESNTVYREVPFNVVADWVQQSRLLPEDMLRPSGTAQWYKVGASPEFMPYIPRSEPYRVDDRAEAEEAVQLDFAWKRKPEDEDDDVDMIPLIDVSLVLLIFFIMTTSAAVAAWINTPETENGLVTNNPEMVWVGVDMDANDLPVFSLGTGNNAPDSEADKNLPTLDALLPRLDSKLAEMQGKVAVTIRAHRGVEAGLVRDLTVELTKRSGPTGKVLKRFITVSEKKYP